MVGGRSHPLIPAAILVVAVLPAGAAQRELTIDERFPSIEGQRVVIDIGEVNLSARAADLQEIEVGGEVRISGVGRRKAEAWVSERTPTFESSPEELRVTIRPESSGFMGLGHLTSRARLTIATPGWVVPDITTTGGAIELRGDFPLASPLRLRSSDGSMDFEGAAAALDIRTASGDVRLTVLRPLEHLSARASSGNITLDGGARGVEIDTASGAVTLANLSGPALVETSTGRISLRWDRLEPGHTLTVRSTSGKIRITLPEGVRPRGTLTTITGAISCDLPGHPSERGDTYELTGDGPLLDVETASSQIVVSTAVRWVD